jgi:F0F1-type ATP synthase membrane subunit b/b'
MPQFDFYSFSQQSFLVLVSFFILYFFFLYFYLPNIAEVLKVRTKLINFYLLNKNINSKALNLYDYFIKKIF